MEMNELIDSVSAQDYKGICLFNDYEIFRCLSSVKRTAAGYDNVPLWVFKNCATEVAPVVIHLYNLISTTSAPPSNWLKALVTPFEKMIHPVTKKISDPILSCQFCRDFLNG
jgi:hypothetical protein